jgi:hypothetical protein
MIPGDDRFRMVEDEFLDTARRFTTHLHRAEYNRLKTLAKSSNAAAIRAIGRPVVGPPTRISKHRTRTTDLAARRASLTTDESTPAPTPRGMGTGLRGLMESPRKEVKTIRSFATTANKGTRAAAGFGSRVGSPAARRAGDGVSDARQQGSDDTDGTDDDLGGSSTRGSALPSAKPSPRVGVGTIKTVHTDTTTRTWKPIDRARSEPNLKRPSHSEAPKRTTFDKGDDSDAEDDDDDDPFGIKKRKMRRAQSREQIRRSSDKPPPTSTSANVIPSFL